MAAKVLMWWCDGDVLVIERRGCFWGVTCFYFLSVFLKLSQSWVNDRWKEVFYVNLSGQISGCGLMGFKVLGVYGTTFVGGGCCYSCKLTPARGGGSPPPAQS